ncbi:MAG TPA: hypothetical protein VFT45_07940 [Longimicrobium sp.]|nr:hypothetical protein [Longimicrobium sp.]
MMRLRDWPPRRIGRLWLAGIAVEALLIAALWLTSDPPPPRYDRHAFGLDTIPEADSASRAEMKKALEDRGFTITRESSPSGDTLVRIGRDSSFVVARVGGDSTVIVDASPDLQRAAGVMVDAWATAAGAAVALVIFLAAVLLPIPILLISITLVWAVQRQPRHGS